MIALWDQIEHTEMDCRKQTVEISFLFIYCCFTNQSLVMCFLLALQHTRLTYPLPKDQSSSSWVSFVCHKCVRHYSPQRSPLVSMK